MHKGMGRRVPRAVARRKLLTAAIVAGAVPALVAGQAVNCDSEFDLGSQLPPIPETVQAQHTEA